MKKLSSGYDDSKRSEQTFEEWKKKKAVSIRWRKKNQIQGSAISLIISREMNYFFCSFVLHLPELCVVTVRTVSKPTEILAGTWIDRPEEER